LPGGRCMVGAGWSGVATTSGPPTTDTDLPHRCTFGGIRRLEVDMQALEGVRVLDFTHLIAGPYATKLWADFGADVIKIERPGGDPARRLGPFQGDDPDPEKSGLFFLLNTNKRSVVLDLKSEPGRDAALALARSADLVVESFRPGTMDRLGLGWEV